MCGLLWQSREGLKAEDDTAGIVMVLQQALRDEETREDAGSEGREMNGGSCTANTESHRKTEGAFHSLYSHLRDPWGSLTFQVSCLSEGTRLCPQTCQIQWCNWKSGLAGSPLGGEGRKGETYK